MIDEFVRYVFSNMKHTHSQYKKIKVKITASYKSWKKNVLKQIETFTKKWIAAIKSEIVEKRRNITTFEKLKKKFNEKFCIKWVEKLFKFVTIMIDFENLNKKIMRFVKCKYFIL